MEYGGPSRITHIFHLNNPPLLPASLVLFSTMVKKGEDDGGERADWSNNEDRTVFLLDELQAVEPKNRGKKGTFKPAGWTIARNSFNGHFKLTHTTSQLKTRY